MILINLKYRYIISNMQQYHLTLFYPEELCLTNLWPNQINELIYENILFTFLYIRVTITFNNVHGAPYPDFSIPKDMLSDTDHLLLVLFSLYVINIVTLFILNIAPYVINTALPPTVSNANYNHHSCLKMVPAILTAASKQKTDISPNPSHACWTQTRFNIASNTKCHVIIIMPTSCHQ